MRKRSRTLMISSVLLTVSLAIMIPQSIRDALVGIRVKEPYGSAINVDAMLGYSILTICFVGLLIIWSGFVNGQRWAWLAMFLIMFLFTWPVVFWQFVPPSWAAFASGPVIEEPGAFLHRGIAQRGLERSALLAVLMCVMMTIGLFLPVKSFFGRRRAEPEV